MRRLLLALVLGSASLPAAAEEPSAAPLAAWEALEALPPKAAWDIGVQVDYTSMSWFHEIGWVGFGARGGWGRMVNPTNRLGIALSASLEGPVPLYWSAVVEPQLTWDHTPGGLLVGASVGPSLMVHSVLENTGTKRTPTLGPMVAARIGYSERFSRAGRRFFAYLEPKGRLLVQDAAPLLDGCVALVVGSGRGL